MRDQMTAPPTIRMRLKMAVTIGGIDHAAGDVVALGLDAARHLLHLRRATPAAPTDLAQLVDAPRLMR